LDSRTHAFDTYVHNLAALEIAAEAFYREAREFPALDWDMFWREIKRPGEFYEEPARSGSTAFPPPLAYAGMMRYNLSVDKKGPACESLRTSGLRGLPGKIA
jgi:hypothetical protein